jgi:hypothetical protein
VALYFLHNLYRLRGLRCGLIRLRDLRRAGPVAPTTGEPLVTFHFIHNLYRLRGLRRRLIGSKLKPDMLYA